MVHCNMPNLNLPRQEAPMRQCALGLRMAENRVKATAVVAAAAVAAAASGCLTPSLLVRFQTHRWIQLPRNKPGRNRRNVRRAVSVQNARDVQIVAEDLAARTA